MAPKTRRQLALLGGLLAVLLILVFSNRAPAPNAATGGRPGAAPGRGSAAAVSQVGIVRLGELAKARPGPGEADRDLFRFQAAPRPTAPPPVRGPAPGRVPEAMAAPAMPVGPPPPPPIVLKFIGLVERAPSGLKLAVLSDGRNVFYGKEGDTIEGRYRIERIDPESIVMAYLDGRGRQTLRLSGS